VQVDEAGVVSRYCLLADGPDSEFGTVRVALHGPLLYADGAPVKLDAETGGSVGRIKLAIADWDADGLPDLLVGTNGNHPPGLNSLRKATVWLLRNIGQPGQPVFTPPEMLGLEAGMPARFGGHSCVPRAVFIRRRCRARHGSPRPPGWLRERASVCLPALIY